MPTLTLQPDAAAGVDTFILVNLPDANIGTFEAMSVRDKAGGLARISLMKFDLSSIPVGSIITSGVLYLRTLYGWWTAGTTTLARILAANSAWTELGATWNYAVDGATRWAGDAGGDGGADAGCSVSGVDYSATPMATFTWPVYVDPIQVDLTSSAFDLAELTAMVSANYGLVHYTTIDNNQSYASSDHATGAWRPKLVITYALPAAGAVRISPSRGGVGLMNAVSISPSRGGIGG